MIALLILDIMKNVQIKGMNVELYDSIEDLPIMRFHKYNKMLLVDAGVGSDLSDFDRHIEKVIRYLNSPTPNMATVELENMRQNIYFIQSEVSPRHLAFAVADVEQCKAQLERAGVAVEAVRVDEYTGRRFVFFADPDGLPLELYEY